MLDTCWRDGYVVVRGLIEPEKLERWLGRLSDIVLGRVPPAQGMLVMKDVMVARGAVQPGSELEAIAKIQDYEKDPVLDSHTTEDHVLDCIERIVDHDVQTIHTMLIDKPPNVDGQHPLHQDLLCFPFRPADRTAHFRRAISAHDTALEVEWVWKTDELFDRRPYRIVLGARKGALWDGSRTGGTLDPLDFIPIG